MLSMSFRDQTRPRLPLLGAVALLSSLAACERDTPAHAGEAPAAEARGAKAETREELREEKAEARDERVDERRAQRGADSDTELTESQRQELLTGYALLAKTLSDESNLGKLEFLKKLMLDSPNDRIGKLMDGLSNVSKIRADELEDLRKLAPDVSDEPARTSPMGEAINDIAKDFGKSDMLSRDGGFDVRFVLVQAQATRMVASMASALARFDPQPKRKEWLQRIARDYEDYRGDLVKYLGGVPAEKK
jgi:hypothetical protein